MRRRLATIALACLLLAPAACSQKRVPGDASPGPAAGDGPAHHFEADTARVKSAEPPRVPDRRRLRLSLRSTPLGAHTSVDGQPLGATPLVWETDDDGQAHEFSFTLGGYAPERYRFVPIQSGVIHASLRRISRPDAGR